MKNRTNSILTLLLIIIILVLAYYINYVPNREHWQSYNQAPFNYIKNGSSPLNFYIRNRYKTPYRYPYKYYKSYPYPNMSYYK